MEKQERISGRTRFMMLATAALIDLLEFLFDLILIGFIINPLLDFLAAGLFAAWFTIHGAPFSGSTKRLGGAVVTFLIELTPLGFLPLWFIDILYSTYNVRKEDAEVNEQIEMKRVQDYTNSVNQKNRIAANDNRRAQQNLNEAAA
jgi:hypothetical protein